MKHVETARLRSVPGNLLLLIVLGVLVASLGYWHASDAADWRLPSTPRMAMALAIMLAWFGLTLGIGYRRARQQRIVQPAAGVAAERMVVAFASQTGFAAELAQRTADSLKAAGIDAVPCELSALDAADLQATERMLFIASTTGEGDAPDSAAIFVRRCMAAPLDLSGLRFGLLALGDRDYADFCGFGARLEQWLRLGGAQALFDTVRVDNGDPAALRHWQHHLSLFAGAPDMPDWQRPDYEPWELVERRLLNPGSAGEACFHLALRKAGGVATWCAGDLVEIGPRHAPADIDDWLARSGFDGRCIVEREERAEPLAYGLAGCYLPDLSTMVAANEQAVADALRALPHREYSIASIPQDGAIHLLVRQMRRTDGGLGTGSAWLTVHAPIGGQIALRIRRNPGFHVIDGERPMILIGNGTGLAGLRALLKQRVATGQRRNWLLFGERHPAQDFFHRDEIEGWQREGMIERLDLAWSRMPSGRAYVQDRLRAAPEVLRAWIAEGAAIYVCGSLAGMAPGVEAALVEILGNDELERLRIEGCYRRDVY